MCDCGDKISKAVCITGMHRSGTSMVARLLNICGVYLGTQDEIIPPRPDNPAGFWENIDFVTLNDEILASKGGGWDFPFPQAADGWELEPALAPLRTKAKELVKVLIEHETWGWKDPRSSFTFPFWKSLLPHLKVLVCLRNPLEVALSLHKRNNNSIPFGLNLWLTYNQRLLAVVGPEDRVVTHYDAYFFDPQAELERVLNWLTMPASKETNTRACETISLPLRHSMFSTQDLLKAGATPEMVGLYRELCVEAGPVYQRAFGDKTVPVTRHKSPLLTSIIILTHNQLEFTKQCLDSIEAYTPEPHELIIVDNGSTDGTIDYLREYIESYDNVRVIANATNRGFAAGNNQGLAIARDEYVLLLNNDTIVTKGWLGSMLAVFDRYPDAGIVGPVSNYISGPQLVENVPYRNLTEMHRFAVKRAAEYAGKIVESNRVVGLCLMARKEVIDRIGGLDERFGSGNFEDDDFCIRVAMAGFKAYFAQDVFIHHAGSQTFKGAGIDYRRSMGRNWETFKAKWGIPADLKMGQGYHLPLKYLNVEQYFVSVDSERVLANHQQNDDHRWWEEVSMSSQQRHTELTDDKGPGFDGLAKPRSTLSEILDRVGRVQGEGDWLQAVELLKDALEKPAAIDDAGAAEILNNLGYCHFMAGQAPEAEGAFKKGLEISPDNLDLLSNLADLYIYTERFNKAIDYLNSALSIAPNDVNVLLSIGNCCVQLGMNDTALMVFQRVLAQAPETEGVGEMVDRLEAVKTGRLAEERQQGRTLFNRARAGLNVEPCRRSPHIVGGNL